MRVRAHVRSSVQTIQEEQQRQLVALAVEKQQP
jgi:hypothetical protein